MPLTTSGRRSVKIDTPWAPLMLVGTGSDVGKSLLVAGLCRIFKQDGLHPAPFKAQNMALNSFVTPEGLEIGRAQAVQAEAAGIPCHTDMNPVLLKPSSDKTSQIVLHGKPIGNKDAYQYFRTIGRGELRQEVNDAFDRLASRYNPIVLEGAGSISELNLQDSDIVNMPMAAHAGARVLLVADIDRGGVFASVYGSVMLQKPEYKKLLVGIIINKFRGDLRLFEGGKKLLEEISGLPVLGVVPFLPDLHIEEEDSVALSKRSFVASQGKINIAVVLLRYISNYTDFARLEQDERVHLFYTNNVEELSHADIIILPGSKSTLSDLYELRRNGVAQAIIRAHRAGKTILGICGGYQMLGYEVHDPYQIEGELNSLPGLGLLPIKTTLTSEKVTTQASFTLLSQPDIPCTGYEIHMGRSKLVEGEHARPLVRMADGREEGCQVGDHCMGTYLHGILDNDIFIQELLRPFADRLDKANTTTQSYEAFKEEQYNRLAQHLREHLDLPRIYQLMKL